jgi:hypothetical protein
MPQLPATPAAHRRETQARMRAVEDQLDKLVAMGMGGGAVQAAPQPTYTSEDAWDLAVTLASNGTEGLPRGSHVECKAVDATTPLQRPYGRTFTTICTSVTLPCLPPMTPAQLLITGLVSASGKFSPSIYERLLSEVPGMVKGRWLRLHEDAAIPGRL